MSRRLKTTIDVTDQFCGAGGSSQGVRKVARRMGGGIEVKMALNHWDLAIKTHNTNFPETDHDCTDISACDPRRYPSTRILITSPECTTHSPAGGRKRVSATLDMFNKLREDPAVQRSRATMWDVCRFAEYHQYDRIIVENVVEAREWILWEAWLNAMHNLGYKHRCVYMNSMFHHPTPQSRDRMYVVFWKKNHRAPKLDFTPVAHCPQCARDVEAVQVFKNPLRKYGVYRKQYIYCCPLHATEVKPYYHCAFNIIDWTDRGTKIGERSKPLSPNSTKRIIYGRDKFGAHPFMINIKHVSGLDCRVKSLSDVVPTIPTEHGVTLVNPPFIIQGEHSRTNNVKLSLESLMTQTTTMSMGVVTPPPMLIECNSTGKAKLLTEATSTFTAGGVNQAIVSTEAFQSFISTYNRTMQATHITEPLSTVTTIDRLALSNGDGDINNWYYRMLKAHEVKLGMAFDADYVVLGSAKEQVKQLGNAVTPPAMEWLFERCVESLN